MNIFKTTKIISRLDEMIENAINGKSIEKSFDETKMSALETKLSRYLAMTGTSKLRLQEEKSHITQLISDISHQTKTPISNILLYSQLLCEADLCENEKVYVNFLTEQAEKLNFLIASLVKTSRLESGIISVCPSLQSIQPLVNNVLKQVENKAQLKNISIENTDIDVYAIFDLKWTTEALFNIVDNAIKYTPCDGFITISVVPYQLFCKIDIRDTGMGISEHEIPKIFMRFYRSSSVTNIEGVGLGLCLSREIITNEGGYIKTSSELDKGSTFSIFLPMKADKEIGESLCNK